MLGQKEIGGLILVLCCSLAYPVRDTGCLQWLRTDAEKLQSAAKNFINMPSYQDYIASISAPLPSCNGSQEEAHNIVKAFHTLFQQLNDSVEDAKTITILQDTISQQSLCLSAWKVTNSSINITYKWENKADLKAFLLQASERYNCMMQKVRII